jgi:hypothetical protein
VPEARFKLLHGHNLYRISAHEFFDSGLVPDGVEDGVGPRHSVAALVDRADL